MAKKATNPGQLTALINPEIVDKSKEITQELEGCLSIPKYFLQINQKNLKILRLLALVDRHKQIVVRYNDLSGKLKKSEFKNFEARVIKIKKIIKKQKALP